MSRTRAPRRPRSGSCRPSAWRTASAWRSFASTSRCGRSAGARRGPGSGSRGSVWVGAWLGAGGPWSGLGMVGPGSGPEPWSDEGLGGRGRGGPGFGSPEEGLGRGPGSAEARVRMCRGWGRPGCGDPGLGWLGSFGPGVGVGQGCLDSGSGWAEVRVAGVWAAGAALLPVLPAARWTRGLEPGGQLQVSGSPAAQAVRDPQKRRVGADQVRRVQQASPYQRPPSAPPLFEVSW